MAQYSNLSKHAARSLWLGRLIKLITVVWLAGIPATFAVLFWFGDQVSRAVPALTTHAEGHNLISAVLTALMLSAVLWIIESAVYTVAMLVLCAMKANLVQP